MGGLPDADGLGPGPEGGRQAAGCGHHVDDCAAHAAQGRNGCVCAWHNVDHRGTYAAQGCSGRARAGQDKRATGTARRTSLLWEYCCARASMGRVQSSLSMPLLLLRRMGRPAWAWPFMLVLGCSFGSLEVPVLAD